MQEGRYSAPSKPSRGYLDSDVEQDDNALRYSLHRNLDQLPPAHVQAASRVKQGRSSTPPFRSLEYRTYSDADLEVGGSATASGSGVCLTWRCCGCCGCCCVFGRHGVGER